MKQAGMLLLALAACVGDSPSTSAPDAGQGGEGQACFSNGTCETGLTCLSNRCVRITDAQVPTDGGAGQDACTANVQTDPLNCGKCGVACGSGICLNGTCATRVFVTQNAWLGDLGGMTAEVQCQTASKKLGGTFLPWIADSNGLPKATFAMKSTGPIVLANAPTTTVVWSSMASLFAGDPLQHPIDRDETGAQQVAVPVWTNVNPDGMTSTMYSCNGWKATDNGTVGNVGKNSMANDSNGGWTVDLSKGTPAPQVCGSPAHLYCFEQ